MSKRKHTEYTLQFKAQVLRHHIEGNEKIIHLSHELSIPTNTISTWKAQKRKIFEEVNKSAQPARKRIRLSDHPDIEKALLYWIKDTVHLHWMDTVFYDKQIVLLRDLDMRNGKQTEDFYTDFAGDMLWSPRECVVKHWIVLTLKLL